MNYYMRKRLEKGLTRSEVANYLGIDYKKYLSIDRGNVKMPKSLIDKFNKLINKGKNENKIERLNREQVVNTWWSKVVDDKNILKSKMEEFNIKTYEELAILLGYKGGSVISTYINDSRKPCFDFKNKLYSFFENELNIQEPKEKSVIKKDYSYKNNQDYIDWYKTFDIKKWLKENNLPLNKFSTYISIPTSTFHYYVNPKDGTTPTIRTIEKVKNGIERYEKEHSSDIEEKEPEITQKNDSDEILIPTFLVDMMEEQKEVTLQDKLINKYTTIVDNLEGQATNIIKEICELKTKLDDINRKKIVYGELLDDIKGEL